MSKLEILNKYLLQWCFFRLARCQEKIIEEFKLESVSVMKNNNHSMSGKCNFYILEWFSIMYFVAPLTGWDSNYRFIFGKCKTFRITKKSPIKKPRATPEAFQINLNL